MIRLLGYVLNELYSTYKREYNRSKSKYYKLYYSGKLDSLLDVADSVNCRLKEKGGKR